MKWDTKAIVIEYSDCRFVISHLENRVKIPLVIVYGHIDDYWDCEKAYDAAWNESYQRTDDLPILLVQPLGHWVWASGDLIPGPGFVDHDADFTDRFDDIPF